jgi:hypothetical protein
MDTSEIQGTQGRRTPQNQRNFMTLLRREGYSVPVIIQRLRDVFGPEARGERTVQNHIRAVDQNRIPWDRFATDGDDVKLIFEVLAEVIKQSDGIKDVFTQEEADTVLWVRKSAPDLPAYFVWVTSCFYMTELRVKPLDAQDFSPMDMFLALKPWQSLDAMIDFDDRYQAGKIGGSRTTGTWEVGQRHSIIEVARLAREHVYGRESEADRVQLVNLAKEGDSQAILALSMVEGWKGIPRGEQEKEVNEEDEIPEKFWPLLEAQGWQPPKEVDDE